jgi:hypothetical protein
MVGAPREPPPLLTRLLRNCGVAVNNELAWEKQFVTYDKNTGEGWVSVNTIWINGTCSAANCIVVANTV